MAFGAVLLQEQWSSTEVVLKIPFLFFAYTKRYGERGEDLELAISKRKSIFTGDRRLEYNEGVRKKEKHIALSWNMLPVKTEDLMNYDKVVWFQNHLYIDLIEILLRLV